MTESIRSLIKSVAPPAVERYLRRAHGRYRARHFTPYVKSIATENVAFDFLIADPVGQEWYDVGEHGVISPEMLFIRDHCLSEGDVIFDCGAHHGFVAMLFSKWTGETGAVVAFEPIPKNAAAIRTNIKMNHIHNIVVEEKALGGSSGSAFFSLASNAHKTDERRGEYKVAMTRLDAYAHLKPHLLLIDVEGYESEVLKGAQEILKRRPKLVIEIHTDMFEAPARQVAELFSLIDIDTYETWIQWDDASQPEPYDRRTPITKRAHLYALPI